MEIIIQVIAFYIYFSTEQDEFKVQQSKFNYFLLDFH